MVLKIYHAFVDDFDTQLPRTSKRFMQEQTFEHYITMIVPLECSSWSWNAA